MNTKLTLDQAWTLCLRQWKWVIANLSTATVSDLKIVWLAKNIRQKERPSAECYFCEYNEQYKLAGKEGCSCCPGRLIDKKFRCGKPAYNYIKKPHEFYKKLLSLNKKRLDKPEKTK